MLIFTNLYCFTHSFCTLGSRILAIPSDGECSKTYGTDMFFKYCEHNEEEELDRTLNNSILANMYKESDFTCDTYFLEHNASWHQVGSF